MNERVKSLIDTLGMAPHPESGWYVETYRAPLLLDGLPHGAPRNASTAIYFLLSRDKPRTDLHRLASGPELAERYASQDGATEEPSLAARIARMTRR